MSLRGSIGHSTVETFEPVHRHVVWLTADSKAWFRLQWELCVLRAIRVAASTWWKVSHAPRLGLKILPVTMWVTTMTMTVTCFCVWPQTQKTKELKHNVWRLPCNPLWQIHPLWKTISWKWPNKKKLIFVSHLWGQTQQILLWWNASSKPGGTRRLC